MFNLRLLLRRIYRDISSLPSLIVVLFVLIGAIQITTTDNDIQLPDWLAVFDLQDLDTIRAMLGAVIGGVFTLTIFAYTMVMNVIDRSISSYSPRLLPLLIGQRYHQVTLGISAGTIAHALLLLLVTTDPTPELFHPPLLAAASSGFFALLSLSSFIYFIHGVSQGIHINKVLRVSYDNTCKAIATLQGMSDRLRYIVVAERPDHTRTLPARSCGYVYDIDYDKLLQLAADRGGSISLDPIPGDFVYEGDALISYLDQADPITMGDLRGRVGVTADEPIRIAKTGFKHLVEVAVKASSPAINDPGTSLTALHYLVQLFEKYAELLPYNVIESEDGNARVWVQQVSIAELYTLCFEELKNYLSNEPWTTQALRDAAHRLTVVFGKHAHTEAADRAAADANSQLAAVSPY